MNLNEYIKELQNIVKENPEYGELEVIYSSIDDSYGKVTTHYCGSLGYLPGINVIRDDDYVYIYGIGEEYVGVDDDDYIKELQENHMNCIIIN